MKEIKPPISFFKPDSQRTLKIRTTLFDLFTVLNEEARVGEEEMVTKIVFDLGTLGMGTLGTLR